MALAESWEGLYAERRQMSQLCERIRQVRDELGAHAVHGLCETALGRGLDGFGRATLAAQVAQVEDEEWS